MRPILFSLGPFHLYSFGLMVLIGLLISLRAMTARAAHDGFPKKEDAADLIFIIVLFGFIGARVFYVIENSAWYLEHPLSVFAIWEGGLIFYGGVAGALLALFIAMKLKKIPYLAGLDFLLPYVALTQAFGRIGCFLNGCCYGKACSFSWCMLFPEFDGPVHPTQLYEAAYAFLLFFLLTRLYDKKQFQGQVTVFYFMLYAAGRFTIEFFRAGHPFFLSFTFNQAFSGVLFLGAFSLFVFLRRRAFHGNA
ncbi:MAG: prolipoprotein diacylglyceryl transferase [Candidatus Omnitrophica bacterium]|nr:prolipoprotein diacylglyceryl transferase [Candidatus Omnitrophota bacterium]